MRKPYLIRTPEWSTTSGGIRVMYGLYGWLLAKGEEAHLNVKTNQPSIGIYPEIYHGNDMESETVVRYILQTVGVMGTSTQSGVFQSGPTQFDKNDKIYVFSRIYDTFGVDDDHILFLPILNTKTFYDQGKKRTKTCYLVGKGQNQYKHPKDSFEITREFAKDQQALADMLNKCHTFYCYDRLSAMMDIARLCGCKVQYYGDFSITDLKKYETGMNGLGYTDEKVQLNTNAFREHYEEMIETFSKRLDKFIEVTQG